LARRAWMRWTRRSMSAVSPAGCGPYPLAQGFEQALCLCWKIAALDGLFDLSCDGIEVFAHRTVQGAQSHCFHHDGSDTSICICKLGRPAIESDADADQRLQMWPWASKGSALRDFFGVEFAMQRRPGCG